MFTRGDHVVITANDARRGQTATGAASNTRLQKTVSTGSSRKSKRESG